MKRKIALFLTVCLMICGLATLGVIAEPTYHSGELLVKTTRYIDVSELPKNYNMFCGIIVREAELLLEDDSKENALKVLEEQGYLEYFIKGTSFYNTVDAVEYLNTRDDVVEATIKYVPYYNTEYPNPMFLMHDENYEYVAYEVSFVMNTYIEPFEYTETSIDFHGVPLKELDVLYSPNILGPVEDWLAAGNDLMYCARIDESMDVSEAIEILEKTEGVIRAMRSRIGYPDEYLGSHRAGDVNDNGKIDMTDYLLLKRVYFGTFEIFNNTPVRCDVNMDDKITMTDYILLKRAYFGTWKTNWEPEINQSTEDEALPD